jgi:hypothetical protein
MNAKKGMSQTLALIVAASVLMMTALTVIFLAQGALGDLGSDSENRGCNGAVDAKAATMSNGDVANVPANCVTSDNNLVNQHPFQNAPSDNGEADTSDTFRNCDGTYNYGNDGAPANC